ncbi:hypothetical protein WICPIJ_006136, partial [Wickerhamomyces pijperi]
ETFESAIVISILLSFLKQNFTKPKVNTDDEQLIEDPDTGELRSTDSQLRLSAKVEDELTIDKDVYRSLQFQIWLGAMLGLAICLAIGAIFVLLFYLIGENYWSLYERVWEAVFSVLSSLVISIMGVSLLRINQMQRKWQVKLSRNMKKNLNQNVDEEVILQHELGVSFRKSPKTWKAKMRGLLDKHSLMILPLVTLLREGLEAIFVITGVTASEPVSSVPLSVILAVGIGSFIGVSLYKGGNKMRLQIFLICSTCFLYLVSAGLMSRGVWFFEFEIFVQRCNGQNMAEVGNGPGSYDIANAIWHVNCCSGINDGGWMLLNALVGWNNTATYGSVLSYNLYWLFIVLMLRVKLYEERHGYLPFIPIKWQLKRILKRYQIIKFNLAYNENYKSNYDSVPFNPDRSNLEDSANFENESAIELDRQRFSMISQGETLLSQGQTLDEDQSEPTTGLLNNSRGTV